MELRITIGRVPKTWEIQFLHHIINSGRSKFARCRLLDSRAMYKVGIQYYGTLLSLRNKKHECYTRLRAHCYVALHRASRMQWQHVDSPIEMGVPLSAPKAEILQTKRSCSEHESQNAWSNEAHFTSGQWSVIPSLWHKYGVF